MAEKETKNTGVERGMEDIASVCISGYYSYLYLNYAPDPHRLFA